MSAPAQPQSPFEALPRYIATSSILSRLTSDDWLNFRLASRACFDVVHGTTDVSAAFCPVCTARDSDGASASNRTRSALNANSINGSRESESLWRLALIRDYRFGEKDDENLLHQSIRVDTRNDAFLSTNDMFTAPNSFVSWKHWRKIDLHFHHISPRGHNIAPSEKVVGPYFLRAGAMWRQIERWFDDEDRSGTLGREIRSSLSPGRPLDPNPRGRVSNARTSAFKAVHAFYAGQREHVMSAVVARARCFNPFTGLFGGFQAYHVVSSTSWMEPDFGTDDDTPTLIIAQGERKAFVMDLLSGQVNFVTPAGDDYRRIAATPSAGETDRDSHGSEDSILRWFEEHADRLHRNFYSVGDIISHEPGGQALYSLLRYPTLADAANCSRAVTRGVEVVASAIFVPEMDVFVYSIRMRLLAPGDGEGYVPPGERGFDGCQLASRRWRIGKLPPGSDRLEFEEVSGEGVAGSYPLLREGRYANYEDGGDGRLRKGRRGGGHFSYQSCTGADMPGLLGGSLQFRPGSLAEPAGEVFDVRVAPFPLKYSYFLY